MQELVIENPADDRWDAFLESTALGQFQQSSAWGRYKKSAGWEVVRLAWSRGEEIVGGFQILVRQTRFGRIGYLPRGPVVPGEEATLLDLTVDRLARAVREKRLRALIAQAPDESQGTKESLARHGFQATSGLGIIDATLVVPLERGFAMVLSAMYPSARQRVRQAQKRGMAVRPGGEPDLPRFYELMLATCDRQGTHRPDPSSLEALRALWDAFRGRIQITLAETEGELAAGLLCLGFGRRLTLWKKGWNSKHNESRPNELLHAHAIEWACQNGFQLCDFAGLSRSTAQTLLEGKPLSEEQMKGRDFFNIGFGGVARLLPPAMVYLPNPFLRLGWRMVVSNRWLSARAERWSAGDS